MQYQKILLEPKKSRRVSAAYIIWFSTSGGHGFICFMKHAGNEPQCRMQTCVFIFDVAGAKLSQVRSRFHAPSAERFPLLPRRQAQRAPTVVE